VLKKMVNSLVESFRWQAGDFPDGTTSPHGVSGCGLSCAERRPGAAHRLSRFDRLGNLSAGGE
ncbi:MAG: hypothetical protein O7F12_09315, partial [Nitrospirae bacterium]|nr:hypothetical protein [Nitrospirota bacterium]